MRILGLENVIDGRIHGRFVWYVLMTTDVEAAKEFYTKVIGWSARDASMPGLEYAVFTAERPQYAG